MREPSAAPILSREQAARYAADLRGSGRTVVFTNGVFDLLHPGHIRYLRDAAALGDALIVALNSDASVKRNKGEGRPITPELERAELLGALDCVAAVTLFDEDTPAEIVQAVQPDVLVKGADWPADQIVGRDTVEARGGRVVRIAVAAGHSTSAMLDRIRKSPAS